MKIGLIDVDGRNFPNLPLMKLSAYHKQHGDIVEWYDEKDQLTKRYDIVYMSKVFTEQYSPVIPEPWNTDQVIKGGTGYGNNNKLPDHIEHAYPDYPLYPGYQDTSYGFLTRGCPRNCGFCIVSEKEGRCSRQVADLNEFHMGQSNIKLLDPNLLACRNHEMLLQQLGKSKAWVDFTQGLDIRLVNPDNIQLLNQIKTKMYHFAWDDPQEDLTKHFQEFNRDCRIKDSRRKGVYVLTNFGSTHEEDLYRVIWLRDHGFDPYVMIYDKPNAPQVTRYLARWVNNKIIFNTIRNFNNYDPKRG